MSRTSEKDIKHGGSYAPGSTRSARQKRKKRGSADAEAEARMRSAKRAESSVRSVVKEDARDLDTEKAIK